MSLTSSLELQPGSKGKSARFLLAVILTSVKKVWTPEIQHNPIVPKTKMMMGLWLLSAEFPLKCLEEHTAALRTGRKKAVLENGGKGSHI